MVSSGNDTVEAEKLTEEVFNIVQRVQEANIQNPYYIISKKF